MSSARTHPPDSTSLSVVIVNYRSWSDVLALVSTLAESPAVESGAAEILVVDNDSAETIPPALLEPQPGIRLLLQSENAGFAAGVNAGWRAARGDWLLVLNPDIMAYSRLIELVLERIESYGKNPDGAPGIVGFGLRNPDGSPQPSVGVFPGLVRTLWEQLIPRARRKYQPDWRVQRGPVDWVTGACFLVNTRLLAAVGGMDEDFFLYHEEVALCRSAHRLGWRVEFDPSVFVVHLRPLQNRAISPKMRVITRHSKLLYFQKHLPAWQFASLSGIVRVEARLRGTWSRWRGKRTEARAWRAVEQIAREMSAGRSQGGRAILTLAEAVEENPDEPDAARIKIPTARQAPKQTHGTSRGSRHLQP